MKRTPYKVILCGRGGFRTRNDDESTRSIGHKGFDDFKQAGITHALTVHIIGARFERLLRYDVSCLVSLTHAPPFARAR